MIPPTPLLIAAQTLLTSAIAWSLKRARSSIAMAIRITTSIVAMPLLFPSLRLMKCMALLFRLSFIKYIFLISSSSYHMAVLSAGIIITPITMTRRSAVGISSFSEAVSPFFLICSLFIFIAFFTS